MGYMIKSDILNALKEDKEASLYLFRKNKKRRNVEEIINFAMIRWDMCWIDCNSIERIMCTRMLRTQMPLANGFRAVRGCQRMQ